MQMLEDFSKGKVLTVKTQRKVLRKKVKREGDSSEAELEGSENEISEEEHCIER